MRRSPIRPITRLPCKASTAEKMISTWMCGWGNDEPMKYTILFILLLRIGAAGAQQHKTENVVVVTLDGMRWQEVFGGIDSSLLTNKSYTREPDALKERFWSGDAGERRK